MTSEQWRRAGWLAGILLLVVVGALAQPATSPRPLVQAHSHNDYEHSRPLFDALDRGFCSVEADVWLVEGRLLVGHNFRDLKSTRTLEALYLDPLRARAEQNRGRVFPNGPSLTLLVDVKSDATNTYTALRATLERYASMLTRFHAARTETNAVTVIVSGNRARELMAAETIRLAAYDGRVADLDPAGSAHLIPLISDNWTTLFRWKAGPDEGPLPAADRDKLKQLADRAHQQGRKLRLWATPDQPAAWEALLEAGVDYINTDNLEGLQRFLLAREQR